jgi:hypothetical protein
MGCARVRRKKLGCAESGPEKNSEQVSVLPDNDHEIEVIFEY